MPADPHSGPLSPARAVLARAALLLPLGAFAATTAAIELPPPDPNYRVSHTAEVIGWKEGETPKAPDGFQVRQYAAGLDNPRWLYVTPNGDVLVAESNTHGSANRITLLRDTDGDGAPDLRSTFLDQLNQPLGMQVIGDWFYVANTDAVWRYPYQTGDQKIHGQGQKILDLPASGYNHHWTRNLLANADNSKLYITVGSGSNAGEHGMAHETRRACILEVDPDGSHERIYASGLRNPVGLAWAPGSQQLWTVVNERDLLGEDLVPDFLTRVREGGFYGWPYAYFGQHEDPRVSEKRPDLVAKTLVPDVPLGAHVAPLGLVFYTQQAFPEKYRGGAFVGEHGSWNRPRFAGYQVTFVPFRDGEPSGPPEEFLGGFIVDNDRVHGRPAGLAVLPSGALLVADDAAGRVWLVTAH